MEHMKLKKALSKREDVPEPVVLDVRPLFERGESPCGAIDQAIANLQRDQLFILIAPFEPHPLYAKLAREGFSNKVERADNSTWKITFKKEPLNVKASPHSCENSSGVNTDIQLDARGLEPPQPLVRVLEHLSQLKCGQKLIFHTDRRPMHLLDQIEERGFLYDCNEQPDHSFITLIWHQHEPAKH